MRGLRVAMGALMVVGCATPSETSAPAPSSTATATASAPPAAAPTSSASAAPADDGKRSVVFVGDLNLALHVGLHLDAKQKGKEVPSTVGPRYPFDHVGTRLAAADLTIGNLECVASMKGTVETWHNPFRCPLAPKVLLDNGFDVVSLANNHALDYGRAGLNGMLEVLAEHELPHFGHENLLGKKQALMVREMGGFTLGLLGYYNLPTPPLDVVIAARDEVDVLITFMHWGQEGSTEPLLLQRRLARQLIEAGVDAVVGTHAHVPQPVEWYRGKLIAHGLGNFVFSGMTHTELHRTVDMLELTLTKGGVAGAKLVRGRLGEDGAPRWVDNPETVLEPPEGGTSPKMVSRGPSR